MQAPRYPYIHSDDEKTAPADNLEIVCAADCPAQPVEWLWPGKIPIGKVTLLIGDPGLGKSLVALDIAARASRAGSWPEAERGAGSTEQGEENPQSELPAPSSPLPASTLLLSAEDDLADTIRPRLDAAGADPRRVFVIPSIADLRHDFAQLRAAVNRAPNCRLIVIDPVNAYVGPSDSHFQTVVQKVLAPLAQLATEKRIAIIAVAHLRKTDGAAIHRAAGSMGFVAAARAVWTVCRDHEHPGQQFLLPIKNNLAPTACGLAYTIQSHDPNAAPSIQWSSIPVTVRAEEALAPLSKKRGPQAVELDDASDWLRKALANGPRPAIQLIELATQIGFHERTLRRALHAIGGNTQNRGLLEGWWWAIPEGTGSFCGVRGAKCACPPSSPQHEAAGTGSFCGVGGAKCACPPASHEADNSPGPKKPVPFPETCPLPEIFNEQPAHVVSSATPHFTPSSLHPPPNHEFAKHPTIAQTLAALDRRDRQKRGARHRSKRDSNGRRRSLSKTGNPLLDELIDEFRQQLHPEPPPP